MKAIPFGITNKKSIAVVGTWDPFISLHSELLQQLRHYSQKLFCNPLVIIFDPSPGQFLAGKANWPIYDDIKTRISHISHCGINSILLIKFTKRDMNASANDFFEVISTHTDLDQMWLGFNQSLES